LFFARSAKKLDSLDFSLPCRAANDFTVSHEINSLSGKKMYVARLRSFHFKNDRMGNKNGENKYGKLRISEIMSKMKDVTEKKKKERRRRKKADFLRFPFLILQFLNFLVFFLKVSF
jgi:hypothetical protein